MNLHYELQQLMKDPGIYEIFEWYYDLNSDIPRKGRTLAFAWAESAYDAKLTAVGPAGMSLEYGAIKISSETAQKFAKVDIPLEELRLENLKISLTAALETAHKEMN